MYESAFMVLGLFCLGMGMTIGLLDRSDTKNRPLAYCLLFIGLAVLITPQASLRAGLSAYFIETILEVLAILMGAEWGRRIGAGATGRRKVVANIFFRISQLLIIAFGVIAVGYGIIAPELASTDEDGFFRTKGLEFALFAPILGSALLCGTIAIVLLLSVKMDYAERQRLRILQNATPFLIAGMIVAERFVPITLSIGLMLLMFGSVRYFIIQGQRGQFMSQFLSPEVSKMVSQQGLNEALRRERRILSVVVCDLRGFTNFARQHDSGIVVDLLEQFYNAVGEAAALFGGTVKDHAGDGVLILVGAPLEVEDHARQALQLAQELLQRTQTMLTARSLEPPVGIGVGVATGAVTVGAIRGAGRLEYVAVGNAVNLAARLCDRASNNQILSDRRTIEELGDTQDFQISEQSPEDLKGFPEPIPVVAVGA